MAEAALTIQTALLQGTKLLEDDGIAAPRLTAEVLLAHAIGCDRAWLYAHATDELRELWWIHYGRYLHQRLNGVPTQQITGVQEFYGREFRVTRDVLIPRPETEHVVEAALEKARALLEAASGGLGTSEPGLIVDLGTGSGAIAATLALELNRPVVATDISLSALKVAASNAARLGADVRFAACDLAAPLPGGAFDLVVCNPPYVPAAEKDSVQREVREHEPGIALYGGEDGLAVYRRVIPEARRILRPGGWLVLEIGYSLADAVRAILNARGEWTNVEVRTDLAGLPRVVLARKPGR